ncbi:MAG: DEAD/DEAH box helicase [Hydrogenophilales bacterium]|nr:DEAD/DEAH box helicase [Hydrogenophilales bacterium]
MKFTDLGLNPLILKALETSGYEAPSPVQAAAIPAALAGADLLVSAQTGSGKTAAFLLPSLHRMAEAPQAKGTSPRILVLTPTRELALQVEKAARTYGHELRRLRTVCLVGGTAYGPQLKAMSQPLDIIVATPGRLMDHMERGRVDFSKLEVLVLDEADRMLDMGFIDDIKSIVARLPAKRQTLLFSATLDGVVGNLARELTRDPQRIEVARVVEEKASIDQRMLISDNHHHKTKLLDALLRGVTVSQAVVFTATKKSAEDLTESLREQGFDAAALHGDMPQAKRTRTLDRLRAGRTKVLVATDVAARGIDVAGISHVINYDAPRQAEDYVHRIGRTGRAGRSGTAVTFAGHQERHLIRNIERYTGVDIAVDVIPGLEPKPPQPRTDRPRSGPKGKPSSYTKSYVAKPWDGAPRSAAGPEAKPAAAGAPRGWIGEKNHGKPSGHKPKRAARSW